MAQPPDITPRVESGRQLIQGYGEGRFRIADTVHAGSVLVFPERTIPWPVAEWTAITVESLSGVTDLDDPPAILLIGCGPRFEPPPGGLREALREYGVVVDWMDTGAACRTFNILLSEDRSAAAALIAVE